MRIVRFSDLQIGVANCGRLDLTVDVDISPNDPDPTFTIVRRIEHSDVTDVVVKLRNKVAAEL